MGWTKHEDAVRAHKREFDKRSRRLRKTLRLPELNPFQTIAAWSDLIQLAKMKRALAGTYMGNGPIDIDLTTAVRTLTKHGSKVRITIRLC